MPRPAQRWKNAAPDAQDLLEEAVKRTGTLPKLAYFQYVAYSSEAGDQTFTVPTATDLPIARVTLTGPCPYLRRKRTFIFMKFAVHPG
jgi:hypothetical protein